MPEVGDDQKDGRAARRAGMGPALGGLVHLFTGLGAICALLATLAIFEGAYERAFGWLFIALVIDAVDGTLARAVDIEANLPRFSGERLDLVIDYMTYVFVPVLALLHAKVLTGWIGSGLAGLILLSSLYHFSDTESKTEDNCFVGFPAVWNLVAFCLLAWGLTGWWANALVALLVALTFVPMRWLHPMRVPWLFATNMAVTFAALVAALCIVWQGFPASFLMGAIVAGAALYYLVLALTRPWA